MRRSSALRLPAFAATTRCLVLWVSALIAGCAAPKAPVFQAQPTVPVQWSVQEQANWQEMHFPAKSPTVYSLDRNAPADGGGQRAALKADAQSSASMLRIPVRIETTELSRLSFSWLVPALIEHADMASRDFDDSPARLVLAFEGDRSKFSPKNAMLNELARLVTGEEMPYATLMYVWCNQRPVNSVIHSPRTDRIRKIVVESGAQGLRQWRNYERDIRADFERAFGEPPGALVGVGLMTDSDNTQSNAIAWYGPIALR
ncbi:MAG: DUF3047 domain-containing protein [Rhodoferax sp.]